MVEASLSKGWRTGMDWKGCSNRFERMETSIEVSAMAERIAVQCCDCETYQVQQVRDRGETAVHGSRERR